MTNALATTTTAPDALAIEQVLIGGDLAPLTAAQRVSYYNAVCTSLGLNPLTRPFDYLRLNNKIVLYPKKDATDQLRMLRGVSITRIVPQYLDDLYVVTADAKTADGRTDSGTGAVCIAGLAGEAKANAIMKAETKAKRRVTLSICGLGMTDETEVETIPTARPVVVNHDTGEIEDQAPPAPEDADGPPAPPLDTRGVGCITEKQQKRLFAIARASGWTTDELKRFLAQECHVEHTREIPIDQYESIISTLQQGRGDPAPQPEEVF